MDKQLLFSLTRKDFVIEAKRGSGKGGQNRNVTNSCCRITHPASGATAQACDQRNYHQNEQTAFKRLLETPKFKTWHKIEVARKVGLLRDLDTKVEEQMKQIKVEVKDQDGKWIIEG